jgi:hypothetical protein
LTLSIAALHQEASAQTVDPATAEFAASADHNAILSNGTPALTRYDLEFYNVGAASPFQVASLGKPSPGAGGIIRVALTSVLTSLPSPGIVYEARVAAVGPGGVGRSTPSNTFSKHDRHRGGAQRDCVAGRRTRRTDESPCHHAMSDHAVVRRSRANRSHVVRTTGEHLPEDER